MLGLLLAILVNRAFKGAGLARTFFFYPVVIPMVAVAFIWLFFYTPDYGMINSFLKTIWSRGIKSIRRFRYCSRCDYGHGYLEGSGLFYDFLFGRTSKYS